jgi:hypothetical protein
MKATFIPAVGTAQVVELDDTNIGNAIRQLVGGWFDCVGEEDFTVYVHDEGILLGQSPNVFASVLTNRPLVGDVVILGNRNAQGEYDGEDYDVPADLCSEEFLLTASTLNADDDFGNGAREALSQDVQRVLDRGPVIVPMTDDEFFAYMEGK